MKVNILVFHLILKLLKNNFTYEKDYGPGHDDLEDGASYEARFVFTGLQAGESQVTVCAQSPIMESYELLYKAVVDADLNVTLTPEATISYLMLWRAGDGNSWYFILSREQGAYYLTRDDTQEPYQVDASVGDQLYQIFDRYDVGSWNGFTGSQHAAHGEQFMLEIRLTDGTYVSARGGFVYPDHYQDVMEKIVGILDRY